MASCVICNSEEADKTYRFAVVDRRTSSETKEYVVARKTTTTIYERFAGVCRESFCDKCLKKQKMKNLRTAVPVAFGLTLLILVVIGLNAGGLSKGFFIASLIISALVSVIALVICLTAKDTSLAKELLFDKRGRRLTYVHVDPSIYMSGNKTTLAKFKEKSGLRTEVAEKIYEKFIESGKGNELVDEIIIRSSNN
ncbi:hypothetical protein SAMN06296952_0302 [Oscillospiraceae bacterium]|nr:hypothetical protein SAMN06296952_0302 [Oscillospiraceae bacterium]